MANYGQMHTTATAEDTRQDLAKMFQKWANATGSKFRWLHPRSRTEAKSIYGKATLWFERDGREATIECDASQRYADNLRSLFMTLDRIRISEASGISLETLVTAAQTLMALPPPRHHEPEPATASGDDPWDVLGLRAGAPLATVEAVWRVAVKDAMQHRDDEAVKRLNVARDAIRQQAAATAGRG